MKIRKYILSYAVLETLLKGEHHYAMTLGLPLDAKIIKYENWDERKRGVVIIVESQEFEEVENIHNCHEYGNLRLEGLPCMPVLSAEVHTN